MKPRGQNAFTMVEMLLVIAVTGVLIGMIATAASWAMDRARLVREINAGRVLISAYTSATADNDGNLLPGYDDRAGGYQIPGGDFVPSAAAHRYPFRLAPYFDYAMDGTILVNRNKAQIAKLAGGAYFRSLYPALGMNVTFVGGWIEGGKIEDEAECIVRVSQVVKSSMTLVFASAGDGSEENKVDGFHRLDPPNKRVKVWMGSDTDEAMLSAPNNYGHVDFRHTGRAVCAFLDGSVRMMSPKDLRDMRYWSPRAQEKDQAGYTITPSGPPPGRGGGR